MTVYRMQVNLQDISLLARDRYVNTLWLAGPDAGTVPDWTLVRSAVSNFYNALGTYLSNTISPAKSFMSIYDPALPLESPPVYTHEFSIPSVGGFHQVLPNEIASCLSFHADPQPGVPRQSWRGRIFIGPLNVTALNVTSGTDPDSRPDAAFLTAAVNAGVSFASDLFTAGARWCIGSKTRHLAYPVASVSMDDAWDVQRSRGFRPSRTVLLPVSTGHDPGIPFSFRLPNGTLSS